MLRKPPGSARLRPSRAPRGCVIDGFAKMPLQASILLHGIINAVSLLRKPPGPRGYAFPRSARLRHDGFAKCPCKQAFLLHGIIKRSKSCFASSGPRATPFPAPRGCVMTLAKCPCRQAFFLHGIINAVSLASQASGLREATPFPRSARLRSLQTVKFSILQNK